MSNTMIVCFNNFQMAELDHDMIGICKSMIDWMVEIRKQVPEDILPAPVSPENFYKLDPHLPREELRSSLRRMLAIATKYQNEENEQVKLINIYTCILAGTYVYHMPTEKMVELSKGGMITRDTAEEALLNNNMSKNWIKEPSGHDYSAIML